LSAAILAETVIPATVPESPYALKNGGSKLAIFKSFSEREMPDLIGHDNVTYLHSSRAIICA
jgi:hypothetical protein